MKNLKMILALVLALAVALSLAACGGESAPEPTETTPVVETEPTVPQAEEADPTEPALEEGMAVYTVTIVDENGSPIPGAMVQMCMDTCFPGVANEEGVASFTVPEADYKVSFLSLPAGYTYSSDAQEFYFESGSYEMTIALKAEA